MQKRLNRSRCRLGADAFGPKEPCIRWGKDQTIHSREECRVSDVAFCQIILDTCYVSLAVVNAGAVA